MTERARPVLEPISAAILHIGPLGTASTLKLAMNMDIAGVAQSLCESLAFCRAAGIADEVFFSALSRNACGMAAGWADEDFIGLMRLVDAKK